MAKFLGVISNSAPSPLIDRVFEFSDLALLANHLFNETENLLHEFLRKIHFSNEEEIQIHDNYKKFAQICEYCQILNSKTLEIEQETAQIGEYLSKMEKYINGMEKAPKDFAACKCTSNLDRNKNLDTLVQISCNMNKIENQMNQVEELQCEMPVKDPCDWSNRVSPFLELHLKILERIEEKINKLTDLLIKVGEMFSRVHKKLVGDCHKTRHDYASDC